MSTLLRNARRYDGTLVDLEIENGRLARVSSEPAPRVSKPAREQLDLDGR